MDYKNLDAIEYLKSLPDRSVDLILLDPPYYKVTKNKWDNQWKTRQDYDHWCKEWIIECSRVAKLNCTVWLFGYIRNRYYSYGQLQENGFTFRQQIIVEKGMRSAAGRTKRDQKIYPTTTESIFQFHYEARPIISEILETERNRLGITAREVNGYLGLSTTGGGAYSGYTNRNMEKMVYPKKEHWIRLKEIMNLPEYDDIVYTFNLQHGLGDVWNDIDFYNERRIHPTQKPLKLINRIIKTSTKEGMIVLDPFSGSGVTAIACKNLNRKFYGCDIDKGYYDDSICRLNNTISIPSILSSI